MINFHPDKQMLELHAQGQLPLSLSIALSAHIEYCGQCQQQCQQLTKALSVEAFSDNSAPAQQEQALLDDLLSNMLSDIDDLPLDTGINLPSSVTVTVKEKQYALPQVFRQQMLSEWQGIGKVSRARLDTGEGKARASLLYIDADGEIPQHTHKGTELTLLLAGEFSDEFSDYKPGDLMVMTAEDKHSPKTKQGCLCYTVVDAPLYFTKGLSKILNPIGELIY
ncbi:ChrR family anti-sigma-E factor [Shewanella intestini]|uniref:Anti-sigma factor n=1 Tax=Shewanella intestini TaxID=2017544 RepID=A0ABS5HZ36_9GAMM|nr:MULTISPECIES: ChrR family anti-sigma-E factor [Shewanella]MBR9727057.1 anti-sigma factor [Shewanella intestini]MRG35859.1 anti-sigma factor [Shewanella sp. XMDDZSB0408]